MQDDTDTAIQDLRKQCGGSLIAQLFEIQKHLITQEKSLEWVKSLTCLSRVHFSSNRYHAAVENKYNRQMKILRRRRVSSYESQSGYVAVSYCWEPSRFEDKHVGGYQIKSIDGRLSFASTVRDIVLDRVLKYVDYYELPGFWIDQECINQSDEHEKETAMQSMDLVYRLSEHPLALISAPIQTQVRLNLLLALLRGDLVVIQTAQQGPIFKHYVPMRTARELLTLIHHLTSDSWWERAWTFQEEYCSSTKLELLIPHSPGLLKAHGKCEFGSIEGELRVNSTQFRKHTTLFCIAYLRKTSQGWKHGHHLCTAILKKTKKYNVLYNYGHSIGDDSMGRAMSVRIITDIWHRGIEKKSDLLAIIANCSDYPRRLNTRELSARAHSLSLAIIGLFLLNGEILMNNKSDGRAASQNVFHYLKYQSFDKFEPPVQGKELTFLKHCRLVDVRFHPDGIRTTGHIWRVHKCIDTQQFRSRLVFDDKRSRFGLKRYERARLRQFAFEVRETYEELAYSLYNYLNQDIQENGKPTSGKRIMDLMAKEVVCAITDGKMVQLGCIVGCTPYHGIFVTDSSCKSQSIYAFTAWETGRPSNPLFGTRYIDKYVSLQVDRDGNTREGIPRLRTKTWMNGLCFFRRSSAQDVVFPWPNSLR
jgi:hypothetical protein